jgi:hypothetical protein
MAVWVDNPICSHTTKYSQNRTEQSVVCVLLITGNEIAV